MYGCIRPYMPKAVLVLVCVVYKACKQRNGKIRRPGQSYNKRSVSLTTVQIWPAPIPVSSNLRVASSSVDLAPSLRNLKRATCPHRPRIWPTFRELVCLKFVGCTVDCSWSVVKLRRPHPLITYIVNIINPCYPWAT